MWGCLEPYDCLGLLFHPAAQTGRLPFSWWLALSAQPSLSPLLTLLSWHSSASELLEITLMERKNWIAHACWVICVCVCFNPEPDRSKCIADANSERAREERRGGYFYKFIVIFWRCIQWNSNGCLHISYGRFQDVWQLAITVTQVTCCSWKISSDCILPHLNLTWLLTTLVLSLIMQLTVLFLRLIHYGDIASFLSCDLQGL